MWIQAPSTSTYSDLLQHIPKYLNSLQPSTLIDDTVPKFGIRSVCFSPAGDFLATGGPDMKLKVSFTF